jgi:hypothetical protein
VREREVKVTVLGDSSSGQRALAQLDDRATKTGNHFDGLGTKLASFGKVAALGLGAAAVGVGAFLKSSAEAAEEARKVMAQTEAVIKSTGGAAKVSAKEVGSLADELAGFTGIDDEIIAGGANMLLTFTNIRNEVGKGNNVFDQATQAALNMSVALGKDMSSSAMLVGKALNDPIAGMSSLTRAGIQFTDQQKEQVKAMVAAGDTLGAQKIILKELETQFGGSAEAAASPMAKLKVVVGNLQEELGARLLPVIGRVAEFLADKLPPALDKVSAAFAVVVEWVRQNWPAIQEVVASVVDAVMVIWDNFGSQIMAVASAAWDMIRSTVEAALDTIQGIVKVVTGIIQGDWSQVWEGIKQILGAAWDFIVARVEFAITLVKETVSVGWEIVKGIFSGAWDGIKSLVREGVAAVIDFFLGFVETFIGLAEKAFGWVPKIGPKLREAKDAIEQFRDDTNAALRGIDDKTITITTVHENVYVTRGDRTYGGDSTAGIEQYHTGGIVPGSGDVPAILQGGEGVFTPEQMAVLGASMGRGGGGLDAKALADAVAAAMAPLIAQLRQSAGMTINMHERADPMHIMREAAWAMGG